MQPAWGEFSAPGQPEAASQLFTEVTHRAESLYSSDHQITHTTEGHARPFLLVVLKAGDLEAPSLDAINFHL